MTVNLDQILKYCNYLLNKNQVADSISPDEFNYVLPVVNQEVFNNELKKVLQVYGQPSFVDAYKNSYLKDVENYWIETGGGQILSLPTGFEMFVAGKVLVGGEYRKLNVLDSVNAFDNINGMMGAVDENAEGFLVGNQLHFTYPVARVEAIYVSKPTTPFYDYCLYGTDALFLPKGCTVSYAFVGQYYYVTINGVQYQDLVEGYPSQSFTPGGYNSKTEDFVWNDKLLPVVVNLIFEKMGINIREQIPIEVSQIKKAQ